MDVTKKPILVCFLILITWCANAQSKLESFEFDQKPLGLVVQSVVEAYGLYVSYDPKVFNNQPKTSIKLTSVSLEEALSKVLGDNFKFHQINEYLVITPVINRSLQKEEKPSVIHDTVYIEKTQVRYDTIPIEVEMQKVITVYDTITFKKEILVYDTISVTPVHHPRKWQLKPYIASHVWMRENKNWKGLSLGISYLYQWKSFHLEAGVAYSHSFCNLNFTTTEPRTELQVDTISTFYIIENDIQVPVYVVDSTYRSYDDVLETNRTNTVEQLAFSLLIGKHFSISEGLTIGIQAGVNLNWTINADEVILKTDATEEPTSPSYHYRIPLQNLQVELPITYTIPDFSAGYYLAPYCLLGVNPDYQDTRLYTRRFLIGLKFGLTF